MGERKIEGLSSRGCRGARKGRVARAYPSPRSVEFGSRAVVASDDVGIGSDAHRR